jgi:flagellar protein FlaF
MYQFSYADIQSDSIADAKNRERQLLDRSIDLLVAAQAKGAKSIQTIEALHFLNRIWTTFIDDLGKPDNELPKELRANLIPIGLWLLREADAIRRGDSDNFSGLIDISQIIRDGIK